MLQFNFSNYLEVVEGLTWNDFDENYDDRFADIIFDSYMQYDVERFWEIDCKIADVRDEIDAIIETLDESVDDNDVTVSEFEEMLDRKRYLSEMLDRLENKRYQLEQEQ